MSIENKQLRLAYAVCFQLQQLSLADFDHFSAAAGRVFGALGQLVGCFVEFGGEGWFRPGEGYGQTAVAAFADGGY
jgi:hypothetical protein